VDGPAARRFIDGDARGAQVIAQQLLAKTSAAPRAPGEVTLVGAGPGDPELLTLKALRALQDADVILYDRLVPEAVLDMARRDAARICVGKAAGGIGSTQEEINALLIEHALEGKRVVRLKGGDPFIFGRGGEELEALRRANIPHQVVPGISAALGAAAAAGISLTDRRVASQVLFSTFSRSPEHGELKWSALTADTTLVLYMPGTDYAEVAERLQNSGLPADLPCVIVSRATHAEQQVRWSTVGSIAAEEKLPAPALFIVGRVASHQISEISKSFWAPRELETPRPAESIA